MITVGILLITLGFIISSALIDAEHLKDKEYIEDHTSRFIQRAIFMGVWMYVNPWYALAGVLLFMGLFDQVLNYLKDSPLFYLGNTAKWDKFFRKRIILYFIVKITCIIGALYIYINEII